MLLLPCRRTHFHRLGIFFRSFFCANFTILFWLQRPHLTFIVVVVGKIAIELNFAVFLLCFGVFTTRLFYVFVVVFILYIFFLLALLIFNFIINDFHVFCHHTFCCFCCCCFLFVVFLLLLFVLWICLFLCWKILYWAINMAKSESIIFDIDCVYRCAPVVPPLSLFIANKIQILLIKVH